MLSLFQNAIDLVKFKFVNRKLVILSPILVSNNDIEREVPNYYNLRVGHWLDILEYPIWDRKRAITK
jgi:hypothetical protein